MIKIFIIGFIIGLIIGLFSEILAVCLCSANKEFEQNYNNVKLNNVKGDDDN